MVISYDAFDKVFLDKVREYNFLLMDELDSTAVVDGYMKRACSQFNKVCKYNIVSFDDELRVITTEIFDDDVIEIIDIVTEGMLVQWLKPYMYNGENYENVLNTVDYSQYSPAELLGRITSAYNMCQENFSNLIKDYSYTHGDLSGLHT